VGVRKAAVAIERLEALQIRIECAPVEIALPAPWEPRPFTRLKRSFEGIFIHLLDADKVEAGNPDLTILVAGWTGTGSREDEKRKESAHGRHAVRQ
jgi:hypothetical protein